MNDKYEVNQQYGFTYVDCDGKVHKKEISTDGFTWMECLNDYVRFLESVFQYKIMPKVRIEEPVWLESMYEHYSDYNDPWTGEYFTDVEEGSQQSTHFSWDE